MIRSMTGYASASGTTGGTAWTWELRAVNARGLDQRLRLPEGLATLEPQVRARIAARLSRGSVSATLRTRPAETGPATLDPARLDATLTALAEIEARAEAQGLALARTTAAEVLARMASLGSSDDAAPDAEALGAACLAGLDAALDQLQAMREAEGTALEATLTGHLDAIAALVDAAEAAAGKRGEAVRAALRQALDRVASEAQVDEARLTQELALIAARQDVTEELDRLRTHVAAARDLIAAGSPAGRKLDFLAQEFNREANTLCSKSQSSALTAIGLDLKAAIEQMREQVQNVE